MTFDGFSSIDFPPINRDVPGFVYVLFVVSQSQEVPFYVGRTKRLWGRLDDYYWAMFSASTDFRVGEAVRYLNTKGCRVILKYKPSADPKTEELGIIKDLSKSSPLLNSVPGFDWKKANESEERERIQDFINGVLLSPNRP